MSQPVVDRLEAVDVHVNQGQPPARSRRPSASLQKPLFEEAPVRKLRQRIMQRKPFDFADEPQVAGRQQPESAADRAQVDRHQGHRFDRPLTEQAARCKAQKCRARANQQAHSIQQEDSASPPVHGAILVRSRRHHGDPAREQSRRKQRRDQTRPHRLPLVHVQPIHNARQENRAYGCRDKRRNPRLAPKHAHAIHPVLSAGDQQDVRG